MSSGKHRHKGVHWYGKGYALSTYSSLHCVQFPLSDISSTKKVFFHFLHIFYHLFIGAAIVKNKCCAFLASTLNCFCFIGNALSVSIISDTARFLKYV